MRFEKSISKASELDPKISILFIDPFTLRRLIASSQLLFSEKIRAIAPGQSAVLYKNNECLGGGIIAKALKD